MSILPCQLRSVGSLAVALWLTTIADGQMSDATYATNARQLVRTALQYELKTNAAQRDRFLQAALRADPDCAPAHWHAAEVQLHDQWLPVAQAMEQLRNDQQLSAYRSRRDAATGTTAGELSLAAWCRQERLPEREQFHLARVVSDPRSTSQQRSTAVVRLQRMLGRGDAARQARREQEAQVERRRQQEAWAARIAKWVRDLQSPVVRRRALAEESLRAIEDVRAIPALESFLSTMSPAGAQLSIEILAEIPDHEATQSLVRHALWDPWPAVAAVAMERLKDRPLHDYVPLLLAQLETPIAMRTAMTPESSGAISRRHLFFREGVQQDFVHILDIVNSPAGVPAMPSRGQNDDAIMNPVLASFRTPTAVFNAAPAAVARGTAELQLRVDAENARITQQNNRVFDVLEGTTFVVLPRDPVAWWNWWRDHNEVADPYADQQKPTQLTYSQDQDRRSLLASGSGISSAGVQECFCAGTLVWSEQGQVAIEALRVGDRVLAQHPNTGELRFQPIVECTVRPPTQIVAVTIEGEPLPILATSGHPFWVNGRGWQMAKKLSDGDYLHTVRGPVHLIGVEMLDEPRPAFNLVVAGPGTYFVGPRAVLVHDNTYRAPTVCVVPGLRGTGL